VLDGDAPLVQALEKEEAEEDISARRARIRERMRAQSQSQRQQEQHEVTAPAFSSTTKRVAVAPVVVDAAMPSKPSNRYESNSEYETDTDDTSSSEEDMMKPVFVPKSKRITIIEEVVRQEEERRKVEKEMQRRQEKKLETRQLVADSIRKMDDKAELDMTDTGSDAGVPDDTDDLDDDIEFENWKLREMTRLNRDAALREARMAEKVDLERRRNLTNEERLAEDTAAGKFTKEKSSRKFLQKYYHKGAFYMDETSVGNGDVRARNYSEPTLEDNFNYEALPEVLQVKNFGKRGRTKYTHLLDQDTTAKADYMVDKRLLGRYLDKRGGVGDIDSAGKLSKKPKS
jgi:microfibrillar-associated protein 1